MPTYWDAAKKKVVVEMNWPEARDLGNELVATGWDKDWGRQLIQEAKKGAGFDD